MDQFLQFMQSIHFENPHLIWWRSLVSFGCIALVAAIVVTAIVWRLWWRGRVQAIEGYGNPDLVARWTALPKRGYAWLTLAALVSMLVLGLTAATMPYQSMGAVSVPSGTVRIVAVFDGSRSMGAEDRDEPPIYGGKSCTLVEGPCGRRIETARLILLNQVMPTIKGNQLGVVVYSGAAVAKSALTNDFVPIETMLNTGWVDVGAGSEVMQRIAVPMIGGMVSSTLLTLIVIPAIYALIKGFSLPRDAQPEALATRDAAGTRP